MMIVDFCNKHDACQAGKQWALENCSTGTMLEAWDKLPDNYLLWVATRDGVLTEKELRLFAVYCARSVEHLLTDERSINAINVAERFAHGATTKEELATARAAAWAAWATARDAASATARDAASAAEATAWATARDAAWAAEDAARDAAWATARDAASAAKATARAARDAAWATARDAQSKWLRDNTIPNFE